MLLLQLRRRAEFTPGVCPRGRIALTAFVRVIAFWTAWVNRSMVRMVRIFILAILGFTLCSCAELFQANPNAPPDDYDNAGHVPGAGDPGN